MTITPALKGLITKQLNKLPLKPDTTPEGYKYMLRFSAYHVFKSKGLPHEQAKHASKKYVETV